MHKIEKTSFGLWLSLSGEITLDEALQIKAELEVILKELKPPFGTLLDFRKMIPVQTEVKRMFQEFEQTAREAGLQRRAIIIHSPVVGSQVTQISHISGTDTIERQINAFVTEGWEEVAIDWITNGIEPTDSLKDDIPIKQPY